MTWLGAHGVVIDPLVHDPPTEATFERVINGDNHRLIGCNEVIDDQPEQDFAELEGGPDGTVQEAMVGREMTFVDQANGPQGGRDSAATRGQERASDEDQCVIKGGAREGNGKSRQSLYDGRRRGGHGGVSAGWSGFPSSVGLACPPFVSKMAKVESASCCGWREMGMRRE